MEHQFTILARLLRVLDLGSSVAESDNLLEVARVETSAFTDLLNDRVDLIPGTKGSGKSALFRIFVNFLPDYLLQHRKVVVAHGVQAPGDPVFQAFGDQFSKLSEQEFINFWCIYLVSLTHEQFIKGPRYKEFLKNAQNEIDAFRNACANAGIPEIAAPKSLRDILQWVLRVVSSWTPKVKYTPPDASGEWEVDLFGRTKSKEKPTEDKSQQELPKYIGVGWGKIHKSGDLDLKNNLVYALLSGPIGTSDLMWPSAKRGIGASPPSQLVVEEVVKPLEKNSFTIIDATQQKLKFRLFAWRAPESIEKISTLEPFHTFEIERRN